jgi:diguanylate cyclase (GGDEF)-like protein
VPPLVAILRPAWVPAGILAGMALLVWLGKPLPESLAGLRLAGPYAALVAALAMAWWFNRGRSFVVAASILAGFAAYHAYPVKPVYVALVVLVPLNVLLAMIQAEVGARHGVALRWIGLIALEAVLVVWIGSAGKSALSGTSWLAMLDHWMLRSPPTPLAGRLVFAAACAAAVWRAWPDFTPTQVGNAGALAAFFVAVEWAGSPEAYAAFMGAAGLILLTSLLHESHRLAFRDQLTGLPGRRALDERLRSLEGDYAIAMADVDHFKAFNDTHGHDIGDQVLKLVAGRLAQVGGGGTAFRYGGEEFAVVFAGTKAADAEPAVEAIRNAIEKYKMVVRAGDRPKQAEEGAKRRGESVSEKMLSVTVSIGLASPTRKHATPQQVLKAADEALYRAKKGGRNRVSR